jgi:hypothetical protein
MAELTGQSICVKAFLFALLCVGADANAQDLAPRAYLITPTGASAVTLAYSFNQGSVFVDPDVPIESPRVKFETETISYYHSFGMFGRSANITGLVPYALGTAQGQVSGASTSIYRSGLADSRVRFAVNLMGGPAVPPRDFRFWREKTLIGMSFTAVLPTGQYDSTRLINVGAHRWAFKPEVGISKRWGRWVSDWYAGAWVFTSNRQWFPGSSVRKQKSVGAGEAHLTYYFKPRLWASFDGNFWFGGRSEINGQLNADEQKNSRVGVTVAIPFDRNQSLKVSYAKGAYVRIGGNYTTISIAWQFSWLEKGD